MKANFRIRSSLLPLCPLLGLVVACGSAGSADDDDPVGAGSGGTLPTGASSGGTVPGTGGISATGAAATGGPATGGIGMGGASAGTAPTGGVTATGAAGGQPTGGAPTGGAQAGGSPAGGAGGTGGAQTGGSPAGGAGGTGGAQTGECPMGLEGFATVSAEGVNGTTGGGNTTPVQVATLAELAAAVEGSEPGVVVVSGTIRTTDGDGYPLAIGSNKTVVGADANATIYGGLRVNDVSNVIIRNLHIQGVWPDSGPDDTLSSRGSHHIWWDHLDVRDAGDGLLDITRESNYQTVSWCKFWYNDSSNDHRLAALIGSGGGDHPEDWDKLKTTYHHNWWAELVKSRMPRVVYGQAHVYNNYYNSTGNSYCVGVGSYGSILVENNYFKDVNNPHQFMYEVWMYAAASGNVYDDSSGAQDTGLGGSRDACPDGDCSIQENFDPGPFDPPYAYNLEAAEGVPDIVTRCAGPR